MRPRVVRRSRPHDPQHRVNRFSADPRLNPEPPARHQRAQHRRHIRTPHPKRSPHKHRKRYSIPRPGVRVQQHRNQHNQIAQQNRPHCLRPVHPARNQPRGQHVRGNAHAHRHPKRSVVVRSPGSFFDRYRREIAIVKRGIDVGKLHFARLHFHPENKLYVEAQAYRKPRKNSTFRTPPRAPPR